MQRRRVLIAAPAVLAAPALLTGCSGAVKTFPEMAEARKAVAALNPRSRTRGAWSVPEVLNHLAQSIEYGMHPIGFPRPRSKWFQYSVGTAAFAYFSARGEMSHTLNEPIPGAPPITGTLAVAKARLISALNDFEAYTGEFKSHFAYGKLDKAQYTRAHLMHLANHWTEFTP